MGQKTDLHTHLNAVLPSEKMKEFAKKLLEKEKEELKKEELEEKDRKQLEQDIKQLEQDIKQLEQVLLNPLELISKTNSWNILQTINGNRNTIKKISIRLRVTVMII